MRMRGKYIFLSGFILLIIGYLLGAYFPPNVDIGKLSPMSKGEYYGNIINGLSAASFAVEKEMHSTFQNGMIMERASSPSIKNRIASPPVRRSSYFFLCILLSPPEKPFSTKKFRTPVRNQQQDHVYDASEKADCC